MKIVRISVHGEAKYGVQLGDVVQGFRSSPFGDPGEFQPDGSVYQLSEVKLLAPCLPSKIIGLGLNYRSHIEEFGLPMPKVPLIFLKPSTAVIGPDDYVILPNLPVKERVDYEGEVGVVIAKRARHVPEERALDYVLGYTCVNDVSARHAQEQDGQWTRAKGFDTFAPIGPCIETEAVPSDIKLETYINGQLRQSFNTSALLFDIPYLVKFISDVMTLLPGDIISTGTASGIGRMNPGDVVEITIQNVGTLRHFVKDEA